MPLTVVQAGVGGTGTTDGFNNFKNRIINGNMVIDQRNAGASVTPTSGQYVVDRFGCFLSAASKFTAQQNAGSVTPPAGFRNYLGFTSSSAYTIGAAEIFGFAQTIEAFNIADLAWGTANAKTVTLSFWVRSSLTGQFGGFLKNGGLNVGGSFNNYFYTYGYTINSANTWEYKTVVIQAPTAGSWETTNGPGVSVCWSLGAGSTYTGGSASWSSTFYNQPAGSVNLVATNGATLYITGVQLEVSSTASGFDYRPYTTELQLCQRYYQKSGLASTGVWTPGSATNAGGDSRIMPRMATTTDRAVVSIPFPVLFRSNPTLTLYPGRADATNTANRVTVYNDPTLCTFTSGLVGSPAAITGTLQALSTNSDAYSFQFTADAEL